MTLCLCGCGVTLGEAPALGGGDGKSDGDDRNGAPACKRVDVVFAIANNDGTTDKEQQALRDAFPAFASKLFDIADGLDDFRIALVDGCAQPATFHTRGRSRECAFVGGNPWMDSSSPSLAAEFGCVAEIDSSDALCTGNGDDEHPVSAAAAALGAAWSGPGKPNAGFLRDDALLAVIALTAEDESPVDNASARDLYDRLVAVKGDVDKMVFVGIGGADDCGNDYGGADEADTLRDITRRFGDRDRGTFVDSCKSSLAQALNKAAGAIEDGCEDFD